MTRHRSAHVLAKILDIHIIEDLIFRRDCHGFNNSVTENRSE